MITSKYFESIMDFKHLELATPKAKGNMEKFRYNPISLNKQTRHYFNHIETLHVYRRGDEEFRDEQFYKRIIHYDVYCDEYVEERQNGDVYLNVILDDGTSE